MSVDCSPGWTTWELMCDFERVRNTPKHHNAWITWMGCCACHFLNPGYTDVDAPNFVSHLQHKIELAHRKSPLNHQYGLTSSSISCLSNQKVHSHDYWETQWSQSEVKELISMTSSVAYDVGCFQIPWSKQDQGCWTTVPKCYHQHWNLATQRRTRVWYLALVNQGCERPQIDCHSTNGLSSWIAATSPMLVRVSSFLLQTQQIARPLLMPISSSLIFRYTSSSMHYSGFNQATALFALKFGGIIGTWAGHLHTKTQWKLLSIAN